MIEVRVSSDTNLVPDLLDRFEILCNDPHFWDFLLQLSIAQKDRSGQNFFNLMPENKLEQQFMFVKPEFIDHWSYQIDNGKQHPDNQV